MMARRALGWTLALAVIAAQPLLAQDHGGMPDVSGEWEVSVMEGVGLLELTVEGHSISGYMTLGDHGRLRLSSLELDGNELYFEVIMEGGALIFVGMVHGDEYIGEMSMEGMPSAEFVAKRKSS